MLIFIKPPFAHNLISQFHHWNLLFFVSLPDPDGETSSIPVPADPLVDDEILEGMEKLYYEDDFDSSDFELKVRRHKIADVTSTLLFCFSNPQRLPATLDLHVIAGDVKRLSSQQRVVGSRFFSGILEKQSACREEMARVEELRSRLREALATCRQGRRGLSGARREFTASSLGILSSHRRRHNAMGVIDNLEKIRTLQRTDDRLQELLSSTSSGDGPDFPGAIRLLLECREVASSYARFSAVRQLRAKLQDTLDMTEERMDVALARACVDFSPGAYGRLHTAYRMLGKTQVKDDGKVSREGGK